MHDRMVRDEGDAHGRRERRGMRRTLRAKWPQREPAPVRTDPYESSKTLVGAGIPQDDAESREASKTNQ
ncbi:MAG: hypothetical protein DYG93_04465 [Leptolyngbya sp. PLA2]|nr:hypothetical protein [Leptolyngbya sp.]MCE7970903.1 hypothetical protein [Leptolyngbya sp. PL-A2]MCQ3940282.1 hypothetical protein [cyanobacterium CYA1]MDL1904648.1 hypothetical protein [Synechococcales cyanobacterium CNB]